MVSSASLNLKAPTKSGSQNSGKHAKSWLFHLLVNVEKSESGPVEDYGDGDSDCSYYDCCDEPRHYIYDVEESSLFLSEVVEPEDHFLLTRSTLMLATPSLCKRIPSITQTRNSTQGIWKIMMDLEPPTTITEW